MMRLTCALLLLAVATCSASQSRIVGGNAVTVDQHPSMLQIQRQVVIGLWTQMCGGVVLTNFHFLTAAQCLSGLFFTPRRSRIIAGSSFRNIGGFRNSVVRVVRHPSFEENRGFDGDIAIGQVEMPMSFSNFIQQAIIVGQDVAVPDNLSVVQTGFGVNMEQFPDIRATQLHAANVVTVNNEVCAANYAGLLIPRKVTSNMICAGAPEGGAGACVGDIGGPLYFRNIVVGIISFGFGCTNANFPRVHTAVSSYTDWIVQNAV